MTRDYTTNLNLVKPKADDQYNVKDFNDNMQAIDDFAGLVPPKALTADKLTTSKNINGIAFDGTKNIITGLGLYSETETYDSTNIVYGYIENNLKIFKSLVDNNIGNALTDITHWEEIKLGGGSGLEVCDIGMALYVDETKGLRRYLNGQIVDINANTQAFFTRLQEITTLYPALLCTEDEWQTAKTMSAFGQVGKFVFNYSGDEVVSVRIPRVVNVQGLFDLQNLGLTVDESLPNITGTAYNILMSFDTTPYGYGALNATKTGFEGVSGNDFNRRGDISFDASCSSSIYQDGAAVQQEAIQYPYFIQIATGSETENNIINDVELNNPFSLFDSKYSDHELNNLSWLRSEGQWNAKAVYPTAYDKLLKVYNGTETVEGLSVKLSTEDYTDYDFVINTADETFMLPLLDGSEDLPSAERYVYTLPTSRGQNYTALYNGIIQLKATSSTTNQFVFLGNITTGELSEMRTPLSNVNNLCNIQVKAGDTFTVDSDNISTINWLANIKNTGNGSLYYYVGETVQNANLIDAGRIGEVLPTKTDKVQAAQASMPSDKYIDLTLGANGTVYTAPADGYFAFGKRASAVGQYFNVTYVSPASIPHWSDVSSGATSNILGHLVPVQKNQIIKIGYNAGGNVIVCRFIYAEGSK